MRIQIVYATIEGQTRKIVTHLESLLESDGHEVHLTDATSVDEGARAADFDAVLDERG